MSEGEETHQPVSLKPLFAVVDEVKYVSRSITTLRLAPIPISGVCHDLEWNQVPQPEHASKLVLCRQDLPFKSTTTVVGSLLNNTE